MALYKATLTKPAVFSGHVYQPGDTIEFPNDALFIQFARQFPWSFTCIETATGNTVPDIGGAVSTAATSVRNAALTAQGIDPSTFPTPG